MSYRVRYTMPDGRPVYWLRNYPTREEAQRAIDERRDATGLAYTVEKAPDAPKPMTTTSYQIRCTGPSGSTFLFRDVYATRCLANEIRDSVERWSGGCFKYTVEEIHDASGHGSTAEHDVEILRARVKELEELVEERGSTVTDAHVANHVMHRDLLFALEIGQAMREAMRHGAWGHDGEGHLASVSAGAWDRFKASLAASVQGTAKASEAPGEGGDSDRRRLEALERYLEGDTFRQIWKTTHGAIVAGTTSEGQEYAAPTLAALADKLMEKEAKP